MDKAFEPGRNTHKMKKWEATQHDKKKEHEKW